MEFSKDKLDRVREIVRRVVSDDQTWLKAVDIRSLEKGHYRMLNYTQGGEKNEFNSLTRGMVIDVSGHFAEELDRVVSFPFARFFNRHEGQAEIVDLNNSEMIEKMDGTMVAVSFPTQNMDEPAWQTRKMLSLNEPDLNYVVTSFHGQKFKLLGLIGEYVKALNFQAHHVGYTFVFEFIHEASYVWTKYNPSQYGLILLGAREMSTYREADEQELDNIAEVLKVRRPRRWDAVNDEDAVVALMEEMVRTHEGFEGFVFRDKTTGNRVKLKDAKYVRESHLLDKLTYRNLIHAVLSGETAEVMAYFPETAVRIEKMRRLINVLAADVTASVLEGKKTVVKKDLALKIVPMLKGLSPRQNYILRQTLTLWELPSEEILPKVHENLKNLGCGLGKSAGSPSAVLELIELVEEPVQKEDE